MMQAILYVIIFTRSHNTDTKHNNVALMASQCYVHYCSGLVYRTAGNSFILERECFVIHFCSAAFICLVFKFPFALFVFLAWNCNFAIALRFNIGSNGLQGLQFGQLPQAIRAFLDTRKVHTCEPL